MSNKNYISQKGYNKIIQEYDDLLKVQRPEICKTIAWAAGNGDRSENADYIYGRKKLREIDSRLRFLKSRLKNIEIVDYLDHSNEKVLFGATITLEDEEENIKKLTIVGADEIDIKKSHYSINSPFGRALLGKQIDDEALIKTPNGDRIFLIKKIEYILY